MDTKVVTSEYRISLRGVMKIYLNGLWWWLHNFGYNENHSSNYTLKVDELYGMRITSQ